jgi:hypothetical protein
MSLSQPDAIHRYCPIRDRALIAWSTAWAVAILVVFGLVAAIIPNPVFGRGLAPEPFAVAVWLVSAPLMGVVLATYFAPMPVGAPVALGTPVRRDGTTAGTRAASSPSLRSAAQRATRLPSSCSAPAAPPMSSGRSSRCSARYRSLFSQALWSGE